MKSNDPMRHCERRQPGPANLTVIIDKAQRVLAGQTAEEMRSIEAANPEADSDTSDALALTTSESDSWVVKQ